MSLAVPRDQAVAIRAACESARLHEDTSPDAIAADQRAVIAAMQKVWRKAGYEPTCEQLGECVDLPTGVVVKRLAEAKTRTRKKVAA